MQAPDTFGGHSLPEDFVRPLRLTCVALLLAAGCGRTAAVRPVDAPAPNMVSGGTRDSSDSQLRQVVADYTGLYRRETLDRWETLFLPGFTAANTREDGTVNVRTREQFFEAQRRYHARVDGLREDLENVRIEQHGPLAMVSADYVVSEGAQRNRGKLALLLIRDATGFHIHSLIFAYDR